MIFNSPNVLYAREYQAISGENLSQLEYLAIGAIFNFLFHHWGEAVHRAFHYLNLSNVFSKQAFHSINLSNIGSFAASQLVGIFWQSKVLKLFWSLKITLTHMPLRALTEIAWIDTVTIFLSDIETLCVVVRGRSLSEN